MKRFGLCLLALMSFGCGVKGDPLPPLEPPTLGRGQPTYRRATEEFPQPPDNAVFRDVEVIEAEPDQDGKRKKDK